MPFGYVSGSCFNSAGIGRELSYDGSFTALVLSMNGLGGAPDALDVNWIALSDEPSLSG